MLSQVPSAIVPGVEPGCGYPPEIVQLIGCDGHGIAVCAVPTSGSTLERR